MSVWGDMIDEGKEEIARLRKENVALLAVAEAARERVTPCDPNCKGRQGCPERMAAVCRALAQWDEVRGGKA